MDRDVWKSVVARVTVADRRVRRALGPERREQVRYSNRLIVSMYCWAVGHDRPLCWACDRAHYGALFRPRKLPSVSQFCKRVKDDERVRQTLQALHELTCDAGGGQAPSLVSCFDGKLLPVAMHSRDPDAHKVRTNAGYLRGYRLHAWADRGKIVVWSVTAANAGEQTVAEALCPHLPPLSPEAVILGDVRYDSAGLYARVAACTAAALLTPLQGKSRSEKKRRGMGAARRSAVEAWERHAPLARMALRDRLQIEGVFGTLTATAGGLAPLPGWVRRLDRVTRWVGVKVIFHNVRCDLRRAA